MYSLGTRPSHVEEGLVPLHMNVLSYCVSECSITSRAYMVLTEVVRETTLSNLVFQVPKYTHPTRVGYQDL